MIRYKFVIIAARSDRSNPQSAYSWIAKKNERKKQQHSHTHCVCNKTKLNSLVALIVILAKIPNSEELMRFQDIISRLISLDAPQRLWIDGFLVVFSSLQFLVTLEYTIYTFEFWIHSLQANCWRITQYLFTCNNWNIRAQIASPKSEFCKSDQFQREILLSMLDLDVSASLPFAAKHIETNKRLAERMRKYEIPIRIQ